jgi:hypothetical protein
MLQNAGNFIQDAVRELLFKSRVLVKESTVSETDKIELSAEDTLLKEQLGFINKISYDIAKITDNILQ